MNIFIVRQLNNHKSNGGTLAPYDFCISKKDYPSDQWLKNKKNNGWHINNTVIYTNFKLELLK